MEVRRTSENTPSETVRKGSEEILQRSNTDHPKALIAPLFGQFLHVLGCIRHKEEGGGVPYLARLNAKLRSALGVFPPRTTERERR